MAGARKKHEAQHAVQQESLDIHHLRLFQYFASRKQRRSNDDEEEAAITETLEDDSDGKEADA